MFIYVTCPHGKNEMTAKHLKKARILKKELGAVVLWNVISCPTHGWWHCAALHNAKVPVFLRTGLCSWAGTRLGVDLQ